MTDLDYQRASTTGMQLTTVAAGAGGDTIPPHEHGALYVRNGGGSTITVTVVVPGTKYGKARPDITFDVEAARVGFFGPLPDDLADPATGRINVSYSGTTSVLVAGLII